MRNTINIEVDGQAYSVTYFSATKSIEVLVELVKIVGPSLANLVQDNDKLLDIKLEEVLPKAVKELVFNMNKTETVALLKQIIDSVSKNGQPILPTFDIEFAGKIGHLLKLLGATLKVQYGDLKNVQSVLAALQ